MIAPDFRWRVDRRKISKANHHAGAVRRGQMQAVMQGGRGKANHLRELACRYERTVRLGDHKNTIEGKSAHVGQRVRDADTAHRFHRMNKKPG